MVTDVHVYSPNDPGTQLARVAIWADNGGPGSVLYEEVKQADGFIAMSPTGQIQVILSTPFLAVANTTYWIGVRAETGEIFSDHLTSTTNPLGDGRSFNFVAASPPGAFCCGDLMLQLFGHAP